VVPLTLLSHGWGQAAGQAHGPCQVDLDVLLPLIWVTWRRRHIYHIRGCSSNTWTGFAKVIVHEQNM